MTPCNYVKDRRKAPSVRAGIRAVHFRPTLPTLTPAGVGHPITQQGQKWRLDWVPPGRWRLSHRPRTGVSEAAAMLSRRQTKSSPRPIGLDHVASTVEKGRWHGPWPITLDGNGGHAPPSGGAGHSERIPNPPHPARGADGASTNPQADSRGLSDQSDVVRETASLPSSRDGTAISNDPTEESPPFRAGRTSRECVRIEEEVRITLPKIAFVANCSYCRL